jgi:hypothetical protein
VPRTQGAEPYNSVWRLHCDARRGEYVLTIEYTAGQHAMQHEDAHERLRQKAYEWLISKGYNPAKCKVELRRLDPKQEPGPLPQHKNDREYNQQPPKHREEEQ